MYLDDFVQVQVEDGAGEDELSIHRGSFLVDGKTVICECMDNGVWQYDLECNGEWHCITVYGEQLENITIHQHYEEELAGEEVVSAFGGIVLPCYSFLLSYYSYWRGGELGVKVKTKRRG